VSALCEVRYEAINSDFRKHIVMLQEMKQGLDSVFKRIRFVYLKNIIKIVFAILCFTGVNCGILDDV